MGHSGFNPPPLLRDAEIAPENDHVIARLEVLVPFRVELVEVRFEWEEVIDNRVDTVIDAPVGESFFNVPHGVIRQERFERIYVPLGAVQLLDNSDLRRIWIGDHWMVLLLLMDRRGDERPVAWVSTRSVDNYYDHRACSAAPSPED